MRRLKQHIVCQKCYDISPHTIVLHDLTTVTKDQLEQKCNNVEEEEPVRGLPCVPAPFVFF